MTDDLDIQTLRWSIRRLIELVDQGIDSAGEQLVRGEDLRVWRTPVEASSTDDPDAGVGPSW
jgi:hypothetical protein